MIFETLNDSAERGELLLVDGGFCHWHLRRDGQLTIREIISTRPGAGTMMLNRLRYTIGATSLFAKCPVDLPSNDWYERRGFVLEGQETTSSGRELNHWRLPLAWVEERNVADAITLIYCANGNARFQQLAMDAGWVSGAQLPGTIYARPYFVDQDYKNPGRWEDYVGTLEQQRPYMATVTDWEAHIPLEVVMDRAEQIAPFVEEIIVIPKVPGGVDRIPHEVNGRPVRLGYSVATGYGSTPVPLDEFGDRPVHLLGGSPRTQIEMAKYLRVVSADMNFHHKMAVRFNQYYATPPSRGCNNAFWPTLRESGFYTQTDAPYRAFEYSCQNIKREWERFLETHTVGELPPPPHQLSLFPLP